MTIHTGSINNNPEPIANRNNFLVLMHLFGKYSPMLCGHLLLSEAAREGHHFIFRMNYTTWDKYDQANSVWGDQLL